MGNAGQTVPAATIAERCAKSDLFRVGYESYMQGKAFDYAISDQAAYYERGRIFALFTQHTKGPRAVWRKGVLAKTARERVIQSLYAGYMR